MYQSKRPHIIAQRKRAARLETIKTIAIALALALAFWALNWLAYFATI